MKADTITLTRFQSPIHRELFFLQQFGSPRSDNCWICWRTFNSLFIGNSFSTIRSEKDLVGNRSARRFNPLFIGNSFSTSDKLMSSSSLVLPVSPRPPLYVARNHWSCHFPERESNSAA